MKTWDVWLEGFVTNGERSSARFEGRWPGETFKEACQNWVNSLSPADQPYFNAQSLTFWGCHLFDNEADARKRFG